MPRVSPAKYIERINRAIDHITRHLASPDKLRLNTLADIAEFSPFHFHRIFQSMVGETPADFTRRLRLEKALGMMIHARPNRRSPLIDIAGACGFASASDFSRSFRQRFGAAPSAFDAERWCAEHRDTLEALSLTAAERARIKRLPATENPDRFRVRIRELAARSVAYIVVHDPYRPDAAANAVQRLMRWADRRGFGNGQWLGFQWDNPEITDLKDCRYYAAVELPIGAAHFKGSGEVGRMEFPAMLVAQVEIRGGIDLELRALQWMYRAWLPRSGYVPDEHPCFEAWIGRPFAHDMEHFELNAQLPIRSSR